MARALLDSVDVPMWCSDREGRLVAFNAAFSELVQRRTGASPSAGEDLLPVVRNLDPAQAAISKQLLERVLSGERVTRERPMMVGDDARRLLVQLFPLRMEAKTEAKTVGVAGLIQDLTGVELERSRALKRSSEELFSKLFHLSPFPIMVLNTTDAGVLDVNEAFSDLTGIAHADAVGQTLDALGLLTEPSVTSTVAKQLRDHGMLRDVEVQVRTPRRGHRCLLLSFVRTGLWGQDVVFAMGQDISARKLAERGLRDSEERLSGIFHASPAPILIAAPATGRILDCNEAYAQMLGFRRSELLGKTTTEAGMWANPADRAELESLLLSKGRAENWEITFRRRGGEVGAMLSSFVSTQIRGVPCFIGVAEDITERKKWEDRRGQAAKLEVIGQLAGGVAHDFNNLLTIILGSTDALIRSNGNPERRRKSLERIRAAAARAAQLTHQLLAFGRQQALQPIRVDPNAHLLHFSQMLRRTLGEGIEIELSLTAGCDRIWMDRTMLDQALLDLALNARDAMPVGGKLTLRTRMVEAGDHSGPVDLPPGRYVVVEVEDTGRGMNSQVMSHLFEPFFTTKRQGEGTGLGLSTVYGIVHQSGGALRVESQPGKGTTFRLYFPAVSTHAHAPESLPEERVLH